MADFELYEKKSKTKEEYQKESEAYRKSRNNRIDVKEKATAINNKRDELINDAIENVDNRSYSEVFCPVTDYGRKAYNAFSINMKFAEKRLLNTVNEDGRAEFSPGSGSRCIRFINRNIDKTKPHWIRNNMIEVFEVLTNSSLLNSKTHFYRPIREEGTILEYLRPFLLDLNESGGFKRFTCYENGAENNEPHIEINDLYGENAAKFAYDSENDAYIVDNIEDIVNFTKVSDYRCYNSLDAFTYKQFLPLKFEVVCGYVPIKTSALLEGKTNSGETIVWA